MSEAAGELGDGWDDGTMHMSHVTCHYMPFHVTTFRVHLLKNMEQQHCRRITFFLGGSIDFETKPFWTTMICSNYSQPRIPIVSRLLLSLLVHVGAMTYHRPEFVEMDQLLKACSLDAGERDSNRHNF